MALNAPLLERKFSCIMALAPPDITDLVLRWGQMFITPDMLYQDPEDPDGFGFEREVHVTVKFGLHEENPSEHLLRILEETQPFEIEIGPCTIFENELYDVVKFDVDSDALRHLNARISNELEVTDTYPDYHPHMTVAYVTKGTCNDLIGKPLVDPANAADFRFIVQSVVFSSKNKTKTTLFLGRPNLNPQRTMEAEEVSPPDSPSCQILAAILGEANEPMDDFDDTEEAESAKDVHGTSFREFTDQDVQEHGGIPGAGHLYAERSELIHSPLRWQTQGLQQTSSGYGRKLNTGYKIAFNGKLYRLYSTTYGNSGSTWFIAKGRRIFVS